ncbi:MAG: hypothetical protein IPJ23_07695 [Ignavibacteriales bacterium]|nr:hypothetical protein [Ignavibacteriales bacterium]
MKLKINFVNQIITLSLLVSVIIFPQDKQQDHSLLAKNFILKNRIDHQRAFIMPYDTADNQKWTKEIEDILHTDKLEYTIRIINKIKSLESFLLQDMTNTRLHLYYSSFYIYNTDNRYDGYDEIDSDNILDYINDHLLVNANDEDLNKIIDLFNEVYFYPMKSVDDSIIFYNGYNSEEFTILDDVVRLDGLLTFFDQQDVRYQRRVCKKYLGDSFIEYYEIYYWFKSNKMNISENLLLKLKADQE